MVLQGARRKNILHGSSTDEQRSSSVKDRQPGGLFSGGHLAALLLSHRALWLCSFVAPCQLPAREQRAHFLFMRWVLRLCEHCCDPAKLLASASLEEWSQWPGLGNQRHSVFSSRIRYWYQVFHASQSSLTFRN